MTIRTAGTVTITTRACIFCGKTSAVELTRDQADAIAARTLIQDVLPDVEPATRELLISGTHPSCWVEAFG
ncbi:hypothetical protein D6T64_04120 [Cryobacterium melibiosiphilum]|uniref:Uncharacterized protein n=1 Tax=Cryobacterium melibiosiphilum TaxID=995039 RepID=A0A3A5MR86_9MICO|nr:hypothetical protein D6T64_04120 [Cryobacterium melibiosiphilum]